jgi:RNA polymerase sigma factor (sigma-70 family)
MPRSTPHANTRTGRYYVHVPAENVIEINGYIKESGMYQSHFLSNALVVGARELAPQHPKSTVLQAITGEHRKLVRHAVEQLAPEQRQVLELAYFEGLSQAEIALRLEKSPAAVNFRMRLALRNLTTSLSSYGPLAE